MWSWSAVLRVALVCAVGAGRGVPPPPAPAPARAPHDVLYQIFSSLKVEPAINKLVEENASRARAARAPHRNDKWTKVLKFTRLGIEPRNSTTYYTTIINKILNERGKYGGFNYSLFDNNIKNIFDTLAETKNNFQNDSRSTTDSDEWQVPREADSVQSDDAADAELGTTNNSTDDDCDAWVPVAPYVSVKQASRSANGSRRVFGGVPTRIRRFPFAASVLARGRLACVGAVIAPDLVISAASCLHFVSLGGRARRVRGEGRRAVLAVRVGSSYFDGAGELVPVLEVYRHPAFDPDSLAHNLAILRLRRLIMFQKSNNKIKKIHIDKNARGRFFESDSVTIVGWGAKTVSNKLRRQKMSMAVLDIYSTADCQDIYSKTYVTKKHFCAGLEASGAGACNSDVGAPGVVRGLLAGVVSFGSPTCGARDSPTVFTKLGYYSDWIGKIIKNKRPKHSVNTTTRLHHTVYTIRNASRFKVAHIQPVRQEVEFQNYLQQLHTFSTTDTVSTRQSRFNVEPMQDIVKSSVGQFMTSQNRNTFREPTLRPYLDHTTVNMNPERHANELSEEQFDLWQYPFALEALKDMSLRQNKNQFSREKLLRPLYGTEFKKSTQPLYTFQTATNMNVAWDPLEYNEEQRFRPLRETEFKMATRSPYTLTPIMSMDLQRDPIQRYGVESTDNNFNLPYKYLLKKLTRRPFMFQTGINTNLERNKLQFGDEQLVRPLYNTRFRIPTRQPYSYPTVAISIDYKVERLERNTVKPNQQFVRTRNGDEPEKSNFLITTNNNKIEAIINTTLEPYKYLQKNKHFNIEKNAQSKTYTNFVPKHTQFNWLHQLYEEKVAAKVTVPARRPLTTQPKERYSKRKDLAMGVLKKRVNQLQLTEQDEAPKTSSDQEINKKIDHLLGNFDKEVISSIEAENLQNRNIMENTMSQDLLNLIEGENQSEKQEGYSVKYQSLNRPEGMSVERYKNSENIFNMNNLSKDLFKGMPKNEVYKILAQAVQMAEN